MNEDRYELDRKRVTEAEILLGERASAIESTRMLPTYSDVRVVSSNNSAWRPDIPRGVVAEFVEKYFQNRINEIDARLNELFPDSAESTGDA